MRYRSDTDWVVHARHGNRESIRRFDELADDGIGISIISVAELYQGVFYSTDPPGNELRRRQFLGGYDIVQLDDEICRAFARERGRLRTAGTPIGDLDVLIGCTALRYGLTLLSNNRRHFERIQGLSVISV